MARNTGRFNFSDNFEVKTQGSLDARLVVANVEDLTNKATWADEEGKVWLYDGMPVSVSSTGDIYVLKSKDGYASMENWKKQGSDAKQIDVIDSLDSDRADAALSANQGKVLNAAITAVSGKVDGIVIPEYTIAKEDGGSKYAAIYKLMKGDQLAGVEINIPKDMVVKSGTVETVTGEEPELPFPGAQKGDLYIHIILNNNDVVNIPANKLVDNYTGSDYITVDGRTISINYEAIKTQLDTDLGITEAKATISSNTSAIETNTNAIAALDETLNHESTGVVARVGVIEGNIITINENLATKASNDTVNGINATVEGLTATVEGHTNDISEINASIVTITSDLSDVTATANKAKEDIAGLIATDNVQTVSKDAASGIALTHDTSAKSVGVSVNVTTLGADLTKVTPEAGSDSPRKEAAISGVNVTVGKDITAQEGGSVVISKDTAVATAIQDLSNKIETAVAGGITSITNEDGFIGVTGTATSKILALNTANVAQAMVTENSAIQLTDNNTFDLFWTEAK